MHFLSLISATFLSLTAFDAALADSQPKPYDVIVYGGTSGGVTAAVQAAKMGKTVALISPTKHLGGMTSSGLGWTDLGDEKILGGLSRDFYHRVYLHYETAEPMTKKGAWNLQTRAAYGNKGQGGPAFNRETETASVFEPKVAEAIFNDLLAENHVQVFTEKLDLSDGVLMAGKRIRALKMENGQEFHGQMFIDATYEGDLLPGAGVSFTVGREANATYSETISGIQAVKSRKNQLPDGIDPYVVKGDPASGLLPGVHPDAGGADGTADHRLQAYCFRMCLTRYAPNRVEIEKPADYDETNYELLFRAIEAGQKSGFFKFDAMPNFKTDSNNTGGISTDFIGENYGDDWDWTTLNYQQREALAAKHRNWQLGLIWTLQHHPRVAAANGGTNLYQNIGLPADEFTDNGHWPWQIYVREGRRMISDYVMQEKNCTGARVADDSVGLAAYAMDSHHTQRIVRNGMVKNEGDVQIKLPIPYPISYRSLIPKADECENLVVPWSLSASHMAFGSIRMEPVFMTLGQSAATAAVLSLDEGTSVQKLPYKKLAAALLADGQVLNWTPTPKN
ncbi:FAD-dependent oxidoreductase [Luteolibacter pohnpeiensis]|uniref:FAD-dependent oxidoreductase n=1 Tax=Luteolibacter pohnpeiensis TaxID=454153 RepID=A0A934S6U0_9BACT|nr:FAD-dependent oxidoreductase [Luteolibacter pohnpeiensis]MBK1882254.1 FAD-dependent oxidoreductase [Luteolibacter pohnpeiensis]